jgi:phage terminase large subunit-like protein
VGRRGPQPLPVAVKQRRGTVEPARERKRRAASGAAPVAVLEPVQAAPQRDYMGIALSYVADVLSGRVVAGEWTRKACERFQRMRQMPLASGFSFSPSHVADVCGWIERLPHVEGRWGSDTIVLQSWQIWLLAAVYGFRRPDGSRLVSTVFFQVGRKSAKSTLTAAAGLYHLACEDEPGAQVVCGASTGNQARIVFAIMQKMVRRSSWLRELGFTAWANGITFGADGSAKPINAKSSTQDGLNPSFISLDESHAQDYSLHDVLKSAQGARPNAALWCPTTAGYSLVSVGYALRSTTMKVLDGVVEADHLFCVLYELDEGDDWRDERVWQKALPMIGTTPSLEYVRRYRDDAIATPGMQGEFLVKMTNAWLHSAANWLSMAAWDKCADPSLTLDSFERERCWIGVDLAERDDIAAVALCFKRDDRIVGFVKGYLPADVVQDRARATPEYRHWVQSGLLTVTDGNMTDYSHIERDIRALCERFDVQQIVFERYGALNVASNLTTDGLPAIIESKNAKVFTAPARELEARVTAGKFRHDGNSFLKWQASNTCVERRVDGSLLPKKESAESANKIDAVDALLLGMSAMLQAPEPREWIPRIEVL